MGDDAAGLHVEVGHYLLVAHLQHRLRRQNLAPMRHQRLIGAVIPAQLLEVIGIGQIVEEQFRIAGQAGVDGVAPHMHDARVRQRQVDQAGEAEVVGRLVGDPVRVGRKLADPVQVGRPKPAEPLVRKPGGCFSK